MTTAVFREHNPTFRTKREAKADYDYKRKRLGKLRSPVGGVLQQKDGFWYGSMLAFNARQLARVFPGHEIHFIV